MTVDPHSEMMHEPAPPETRELLPEPEAFVRGIALAGLAVGAAWFAVSSARASWLLTPVALVLGAASILSGWAAAIHVTGGEKFDDHPFV